MKNENETQFQIASRTKLRFKSTRGQFNTEDLWDLSLKSLDVIAVAVSDGLQPQGKSFLANPDRRIVKENEENELRLNILKTIIGVKQDENSAKLLASKKRSQLEFLENLKEKKELTNLEGMTIEEIDKQIAALNS